MPSVNFYDEEEFVLHFDIYCKQCRIKSNTEYILLRLKRNVAFKNFVYFKNQQNMNNFEKRFSCQNDFMKKKKFLKCILTVVGGIRA